MLGSSVCGSGLCQALSLELFALFPPSIDLLPLFVLSLPSLSSEVLLISVDHSRLDSNQLHCSNTLSRSRAFLRAFCSHCLHGGCICIHQFRFRHRTSLQGCCHCLKNWNWYLFPVVIAKARFFPYRPLLSVGYLVRWLYAFHQKCACLQYSTPLFSFQFCCRRISQSGIYVIRHSQ